MERAQSSSGSIFERKGASAMAMQADRVSPQESKEHLKSGALLVCGYDSEEKFQGNHLEGAISLGEFKTREKQIARDHEIIFYCA
jgi:rhodanese-related sulfurtransferase